jgi:NADH-quinone oxidoreductase E subunit
MCNAPQSKCCCGSQVNQYAQVDEILAKYKEQKGALIPVLQQAQHAYGYLSQDVLIRIACGLKIPLSQVYGVVTFYSQFHLKPRGRNIIRICQGTACHVRGAKAVLQEIEKKLGIKAGETTSDLRYTLETVACIGACGLAPVLMVNDDTHGRLTAAKVTEIIEAYE